MIIDPPNSKSGVHRLLAVEALRGFASAWVLLFHSLAAIDPAALHPALRVVYEFTRHGWLGVHVFFAISGWCIAERLAAANRRNESTRFFLRERALRIFPTYWAAYGLMLAARLVALPFNTASINAQFPASAQNWFADLFLINPYLGAPALLIVSWSLVYELGFYFLGAGALFLRRRGVPAVVLAALGMLLCLWPLLGVRIKFTYVLGLWPDFFAGVLVWWAVRAPSSVSRLSRGAGVAGLFAMTLLWPSGYGGPSRLAALGGAMVMWAFAMRERGSTPGRTMAILAWVGGFSYSLYLVHLTVLSPTMNLVQRFVQPSQPIFCVVWLAIVVLSFFAGWCLYRWVEGPIERWRKARWAPRRVTV